MTVISIIVFIFADTSRTVLHRKHHFSNFYYDHFWWHDDRSDCCHDWDTGNHLYCYRYCPFVTTTWCAHAVTHDSVIMFAIAGPIDISITFAMIICFFPHRYSAVVGLVLINAVFTDMEAKGASATDRTRFPASIRSVEASASLAIKILRSENIL